MLSLKTILQYLATAIVSIVLGFAQVFIGLFMILFLGAIWKLTTEPRIKRYTTRLFLSIDQFFNTLLFGDEDETISSRLGKHRENCRFCKLTCWLLDIIEEDHCKKAIENEKK